MRVVAAKILMGVAALGFAAATTLMFSKHNPFYTYYFLFAWWAYILFADGWLYLRSGESPFLSHPIDFITFLVPLSAVLWFGFEAFNLRLQDWFYVGVPTEMGRRWIGNFLAFGTVLPGVFVTVDLLDYYGVCRRNEFSQFFSAPLSNAARAALIAGGVAMLGLPLIAPRIFFPLVWGGFVLLLDPINAEWNGPSLIQEWRQKNWNRTGQLLLAGLVCGGLWEFWNFWAGAKWVYSVPLPEKWQIKVFEMPLLGFLGFPPFALECFVLTEFARKLRERLPAWGWRLACLAGLGFSLWMCRAMDLHTVHSFR